jgi:cytochrome b involved in lipid metabolism
MSINYFSIEEVSKHNKEEDLWVIINNKIYDLTKFAKVHPGGKGVLIPVAGKDCTKEFYALHCERVLTKYGPKLLVGHVLNTTPIQMNSPVDLSPVPYGESSGFTKGFHTPYY